MPSNVEIKAHARSLVELGSIVVARMGASSARRTSSSMSRGAGLKLRITSPETGELIFYDREDVAGPKTSSYMIFETHEPHTLQTVLSVALAVSDSFGSFN